MTDHCCHSPSKIYPAFLKIKKCADEWRPWSGGAVLKEQTLEKIADRWEYNEFNVHYTAYAGDVEFHAEPCNPRVVEGLKAVIRQWAFSRTAEAETFQQWVDFKATILTQAAVDDAKNMHMRQWWVYHGEQWPALQEVMIKAHSCGATASMCERNWSEWKHVFNSRARLGNDTAEKWVYVYGNSRELAKGVGAANQPKRASFIPWGYMDEI